jgi:diacylglycerol kinase (ATP)
MWLIVVNTSAGKGRARKLSDDFIDLLKKDNQDFKVINTNAESETKNLVDIELSSQKYRNCIAVGGDGLVNLCLQYIAQKPINMIVIPAGTGNDFARAIGTYGKSVDEIYKYIKTNPADLIDLGKITGTFGERWYVQVLSTGFDALVNSLANQVRWPRGRLKYTLSTLLTLARFKPIHYEIDIDGKQLTMQAMLLSVANGQTYGGGMKICPNASNSDGFFDILIVKPVSRIVLLTIFPKVFFGKHIPHPKIEIFRAKRVVISGPTFAHADGEYVSALPITISNVSNSLRTWLFQ